MRQQHAQRDGALLGLRRPVGLEHGPVLELGDERLQLLAVVEGEDALLDELHAAEASDHLGARGHPVNAIFVQGLGGGCRGSGDGAHAGAVLEEGLAIFGDGEEGEVGHGAFTFDCGR